MWRSQAHVAWVLGRWFSVFEGNNPSFKGCACSVRLSLLIPHVQVCALAPMSVSLALGSELVCQLLLISPSACFASEPEAGRSVQHPLVSLLPNHSQHLLVSSTQPVSSHQELSLPSDKAVPLAVERGAGFEGPLLSRAWTMGGRSLSPLQSTPGLSRHCPTLGSIQVCSLSTAAIAAGFSVSLVILALMLFPQNQ